MKRQANQYGLSDDIASLIIVQSNGNEVVSLFPSVYLDDIKRFHWAFKGKNGIFNEFNVSFAAYFANIYGYSATNWRRKDATSSSYFKDNYQEKLLTHGKDVKNWQPIKSEHRFTGREQVFYERIKWASKYKCEVLPVVVGAYTLHVKVNSYLRHAIPTHADFHEGDLWLFNGDRVAKNVILAAGGGPDADNKRVGASYTNRECNIDYRVDPNTIRFADEPYSHHRIHRITVDGNDCVIFEQIDSPKDSKRYNWIWKEKAAHETFLLGESGGWRRSFVMFDAKYLNDLYKLSEDLNIYYRYFDQEWVINERIVNSIGELEFKEHQLKRTLLRASGAKVDYEYFAPRMSKAYADALAKAEADEGFGKADRTVAKFENATTEEKGNRGKMFVKPKVQHHRKIYAYKNYFSTEIYGGVGIWCKDMRVDSLLIGTNAQLQGVVVDNKTQIRKRRL